MPYSATAAGPTEYFLEPSSSFVEFLRSTHLSELTRSEASDGSLVLYSAHSITHAGRVSGQRILSKWGTCHLWYHGLYEVPLRYGDTVRFFTPPPREQVVAAFVEFARIHLGAELVDALL